MQAECRENTQDAVLRRMSLSSLESVVLALKQRGGGADSVTCRKRGYAGRSARYEHDFPSQDQ